MENKQAALNPEQATSPLDGEAGRAMIETAKSIFYGIMIALVIRAFMYEPFEVQSSSMAPTILTGDHVFLNKYAYGYGSKTIRYAPWLIPDRTLYAPPERGDVVAFEPTVRTRTGERFPPFVKRVIGLPGERIKMTGGRLFINDRLVPRSLIGTGTAEVPGGQAGPTQHYIEYLPGCDGHEIQEISDVMNMDNTPEFRVPEDSYFVMGDNRDDSMDSRVQTLIGFVASDSIIGRSDFRFFSIEKNATPWHPTEWFGKIRYERLFTDIR